MPCPQPRKAARVGDRDCCLDNSGCWEYIEDATGRYWEWKPASGRTGTGTGTNTGLNTGLNSSTNTDNTTTNSGTNTPTRFGHDPWDWRKTIDDQWNRLNDSRGRTNQQLEREAEEGLKRAQAEGEERLREEQLNQPGTGKEPEKEPSGPPKNPPKKGAPTKCKCKKMPGGRGYYIEITDKNGQPISPGFYQYNSKDFGKTWQRDPGMDTYGVKIEETPDGGCKCTTRAGRMLPVGSGRGIPDIDETNFSLQQDAVRLNNRRLNIPPVEPPPSYLKNSPLPSWVDKMQWPKDRKLKNFTDADKIYKFNSGGIFHAIDATKVFREYDKAMTDLLRDLENFNISFPLNSGDPFDPDMILLI